MRPNDVALDSAGNLYIADRPISRILKYNTPSPPKIPPLTWSSDRMASLPAPAVTAPSTTQPQARRACVIHPAIALDADDNLYVADTFNNRVFEEYDKPLPLIATPSRPPPPPGWCEDRSALKGHAEAGRHRKPSRLEAELRDKSQYRG